MTVPTQPRPALYRHKPTLAQALQYTEEQRDAVYAWLDSVGARYWVDAAGITRLAMVKQSRPLLLGDWAVLGIDDRFDALVDRVFRDSYDPYDRQEPGQASPQGPLEPLARVEAAAADRDATDAIWRAAIRVAAAAGATPRQVARSAGVNTSVVRQILGTGS